ncbi:TPA: hypothetical protein AB5C14_003432, partial [Vibrio cholerae]
WAGKYPIPKNSRQLQQHRTTTSVTEQRKVKFGDLDVNEPNGALDFDNLKPMWLKISKMY